MKKKIFGRQFKRDINERKALFKSLMNALVIEESIHTTEEKAKAIKSKIEKMISKAKQRKEEARKFLQPYFSSLAINKIITDIAPRFSTRNGGYTRLIKTKKRFSDNASMVIMEWVQKPEIMQLIPMKQDTKEANVKVLNASKEPHLVEEKKTLKTKTKKNKISKEKK